ncbi:WecB/TagA/CpsF family glycosyltransferase [Arthrobacter sunyaminii]|uniref:WecB/TagA/CpsF family glycosyltransferase n=1 Tax=Arthrobacter sunyaminii TaxID=2816859 RepID=UPI001A943C6E|nr:WecB/TagA/CpsF family glycosyltransferase [Arthrobacter sunyaminii]
MQKVILGGVRVDLLDIDDVVRQIASTAEGDAVVSNTGPLAVISANLDHIAHFGTDGRWFDTLGDRLCTDDSGNAQWLTLLDGAPLVAEANRLTGRSWPRLAGSDLIGPLLDEAEARGTVVGFLGGTRLIQRLLSRNLTRTRPALIVGGLWSPDRSALTDPEVCRDLAESIKAAQVQLLVVGLGKPRQELWIAEYGPLTGANVLLAFGAVVDFLAGSIGRAPHWASARGLEWVWRLALEPRRLARRYLIDDPPSYFHMRRNSSLSSAADGSIQREGHRETVHFSDEGTPDGSFVAIGDPADVVVCIVTYNSSALLDPLVAGLRGEARNLRLRVVVAENDSSDGTLEALSKYPDIIVVPTGGNLGYAAGINAARRFADRDEAILVLNPDVRVEPGAIRSMYRRLVRSGAGIVVPQLLESDGSVYPSLRREPTILNALGDAILGRRLPNRPWWLSGTDYDPESYRHPHRFQWATGAALLVRADLAEQLGDWDEQFFLYSEEVDYFRRARAAGAGLWFEPTARVTHWRGGSGVSPELNALMAVNRIRYARKYHSKPYASGYHAVVVLSEALRWAKSDRRGVLRTVLDDCTWDALPGPTASANAAQVLERFPRGAVIIPAHNEAAVIGRTLAPLASLAASGRIELIVACNGCTDSTADTAADFDGITVIEVEEASKTAALNTADAHASLWPRVYLDADITISPAALGMMLDRLERGDVLAARPAFRYNSSGASFMVRSYYRARRRLPSTKQALWGAGVYGLTEAGHARFGQFPSVTADDLLVERALAGVQKVIVNTPPVSVQTPRTPESLMSILTRNYRGNAELDSNGPGEVVRKAHTRQTLRELLASIRGPATAFDAIVYAYFTLRARSKASQRPVRGEAEAWERDESSRHQ